jgi:hypothetical protein
MFARRQADGIDTHEYATRIDRDERRGAHLFTRRIDDVRCVRRSTIGCVHAGRNGACDEHACGRGHHNRLHFHVASVSLT